MKAIQIESFGSPAEVVKAVDIPDVGTPAAGEVVIALEQYRDALAHAARPVAPARCSSPGDGEVDPRKGLE
jgi:NADPH:quinone reductase-like Zn-dependent oxidoreductase